jgi:hypothetical protein
MPASGAEAWVILTAYAALKAPLFHGAARIPRTTWVRRDCKTNQLHNGISDCKTDQLRGQKSMSKASAKSIRPTRLQVHFPEAQGVCDYRHRTEAHGCGGEDWAEQHAEEWVKNARCDGHAHGVVDEGEE